MPKNKLLKIRALSSFRVDAKEAEVGDGMQIWEANKEYEAAEPVARYLVNSKLAELVRK